MEQKKKRSSEKERMPLPPKTMVLLVVGLIGIFLIGIAPMLTKEAASQQTNSSKPLSAEEYANALEQKLCGILGQIEGVGQVEVMVTLKSGYTYSYAVTEKKDTDISEEYKSEDQRKTQQKNTTEQSYVLIEEADRAVPLITELGEPEIKGVVVVCEGGGDPAVVLRVTESVRIALDISSARITVSKRSTAAR